MILNSTIDLAHYRGAELTDAKTHGVAKKISMVSDGGSDPNALVPVSVAMKLTSGEVRKWKCEQMLASPSRRLTREQRLTKFRRCLEFSARPMGTSQGTKLIAAVDDLETMTDIRELVGLLSPAGPAEKAML